MIDIEKIVKLAECGYSLDFEFGKFSKVYMHTTENIKEFLSCFDLNKKRVLTVAGRWRSASKCLCFRSIIG